jgi:hypothetical protein
MMIQKKKKEKKRLVVVVGWGFVTWGLGGASGSVVGTHE